MSPREFDLLVACCRCNVGDTGETDFHPLASEVRWPLFLQLTRRHRVQGLVARAFRDGSYSPPAAVTEELEAEAVGIAERNLRAAQESARIVGASEKAGVDVLFVKGLTLSALAYGDPYLKMSADIDVLVRTNETDEAANLLARLGYALAVPRRRNSGPSLARWHSRHKESVWHNPQAGLVLDLHTRLADNPALIPGVGMDSPRQPVGAGMPAQLPTLGPDDLFAYLCVHGSSSAWFRLKWIVDLAAFVRRSGSAIEHLYRESQIRHAGRAAAQALLLAQRLSLLDLPAALRQRLQADVTNRLLAGVAARQLSRPSEPTQRMLGTVSIRLSQPLLAPGWRFTVTEALRQLQDVLDRP